MKGNGAFAQTGLELEFQQKDEHVDDWEGHDTETHQGLLRIGNGFDVEEVVGLISWDEVLESAGETKTDEEVEHLASEETSQSHNFKALSSQRVVHEHVHETVADAQNGQSHKKSAQASQTLQEMEQVNIQIDQEAEPLNAYQRTDQQPEYSWSRL